MSLMHTCVWRAAVLVLLVWPAAVTADEGPEPAFTQRPTAERQGDGVTIRFAVNRATDVTVFIEDAAGRVVRRLAAGVLGANPPAPFQPNSLAQTLTWDGTDDLGQPAAGGPFKVRVGLGTRPRFDGFLLYNPDSSGRVDALAVGPKGTVYLFHRDVSAGVGGGSQKVKVLSREGRHLRALTPFPADIAPERVKALRPFQTTQGGFVPRIHNWHQFSVYPDPLWARGQSMPARSSPAVDSRGRVYWLLLGPVLAAVDADGGVPYQTFLGPRLLPDIKDLRMANGLGQGYPNERPCLAVSSDDRYLYLAGLSYREEGRKEPYRPLPCVFRIDASARGPGEVFIGRLDEPGTEKDRLTAPMGLAVANGLLYVADRAANRVAVFKESDRSFVGEIRTQAPDTIGVDPATGAVYVCAATTKEVYDLVKIDNPGSGKELYRMPLPKVPGSWARDGQHRIAVDASARPVLIWLPTLHYTHPRLLCIEDAGDRFVIRGDPRRPGVSVDGPRDMSVDRLRGELYVKSGSQKWYRIREKTGEVIDVVDLTRYAELNLGNKGTQLVPALDGSLNTFSWDVGLHRFDHDVKPLNWPGQETHRINLKAVMSYHIRGLACLRSDELYVVPQSVLWTWSSLKVIGPDGTTRRTAVWQCMSGAIPKLDLKGNIYLADMVKPPDRSYPAFFDGRLAPPPKKGRAASDQFWASYIYGSIVKFPPEGGAIWSCSPAQKARWLALRGQKARSYGEAFPEDPPADVLARPKVPIKVHIGRDEFHAPGELQGALWYRFGFAPYTVTSSGSGDTCMCDGGGYDVDFFGRVFYPNLGQFRVEMVDTNNNFIVAFGQYGNQDSGGSNALVPKPEIPLAWPIAVAVSDTHAYVADTVNRRVVKVKLDYAAEAVCAIP